jgi:hypothetical protein
LGRLARSNCPSKEEASVSDDPIQQSINSHEQDGGKAFLLLEYQSLQSLHQGVKEDGDKRLNFFVTFIAAIGAFLVAIVNVVDSRVYGWVLAGGMAFVVLVGLINFRKMLQRRAAAIVYRRRMSRIRAWFAIRDPAILSALPYRISPGMSMDWGKNRLGSTASSFAIINSVTVTIMLVTIIASIADMLTSWWLLLLSPLAELLIWWLHLVWKARWLAGADARDQKELHVLDELAIH